MVDCPERIRTPAATDCRWRALHPRPCLNGRFRRGLILVFALATGGCATPVGVTKVTPQQASRARAASALTTDKPSATFTQFLYRLDLADRARDDPEGALKILHDGLGGVDESDRLVALAEFSFIYARKSGNRSYYLAAAAYAWAYLFPEDRAQRPDRYDTRVALALSIYNQGIAAGLSKREGEEQFVDLSARAIDLPFATLQLESDSDEFRYGGNKLTNFTSLADLKVRGLRNRYRRRGIGAVLVASPLHAGDAPQGKVPVTAILRFDHPRRGMTDGTLRGAIELHDAEAVPDTDIQGDDVPLETDSSAALASRLERSALWDLEVAGFRRGNLDGFYKNKDAGLEPGSGLLMLHPYTPGRIPIVFVHGTASSPARWAEMANEILGDPRLAQKYQCWFFLYTSGNPIAYSALHLREALQVTLRELDAEGQDAALQKMVLIGHSQGGLLAKMLMVDSSTRFWDNISKVPFDQEKLSPETRDLLRRALFVEPLPFVKRGIFIATPQHGSYVADNFFGNLGRRFVSFPGNLARMGGEILTLSSGPNPLMTRFPTSVDNMKSSNPFLKTLSSLPIAPGVYTNSIIAVKGTGPAAAGGDGVVAYQSAHIDGVDSELVVRSSHSTQGTPATIEEVRRILYLHLQEP